MIKLDVHTVSSALTAVRAAKLAGVLDVLRANFDVEVHDAKGPEAEELTPEKTRNLVTIEKTGDPVFDGLLRNLHPKQVSNSLKHLGALRAIATSTRPGAYALVLEDDPVVPEDFAAKFGEMLRALPSDWEMVMLGLPGPAAGFAPLETAYKALPVCNSYMIRPMTASKISNTFLPVRYTTNIHLTHVARAFGVAPLLYSPHLLIDGSKYGAFVSTLSPSNELIFNRDFLTASAAAREGRFADALEAVAASALRDHPDFMHLQAVCEAGAGDREKAGETFRKALEVFEANHATLNNESRFLVDYIDNFRPRED